MSESKFHLSLNVRDLREMAGFLELLLGVAPAQLHSDYAKFELADPPLVLSLVPTDLPASVALNHLGFRLANSAALSALRSRLSEAGIFFECEDNVACCHSRQTKLWVQDPAGNLWELYVLDEPVACAPETIAITPLTPAARVPSKPKSWSHRLGHPFPERIPAADADIQEVVLEGTINAALAQDQLPQILSDVARALCAGGKLMLRGLTSDRPLAQAPRLPGPASGVQYVPTTDDLLSALDDAGFASIELLTFGETYRFAHAGAELRETRLRAFRRAFQSDLAEAPRERVLVYRGPFAELRDDDGQVYRRGARALVDEATWQRLQASGVAEQFVALPAAAPVRS